MSRFHHRRLIGLPLNPGECGGSYTEQYVAYQGRYFTRMVDATDRSTGITVQDIHALTQPEATLATSHMAQVTRPPTERGR